MGILHGRLVHGGTRVSVVLRQCVRRIPLARDLSLCQASNCASNREANCTFNNNNNNNNNNNHGSTALYGLWPPLSEVTWSAHLCQFGDQPTGRAVELNPDVTARAIWQAVRRRG
jgi:hypothetical protein